MSVLPAHLVHTPQFWKWCFKPMEYPDPTGKPLGMTPYELTKGSVPRAMFMYIIKRAVLDVYRETLYPGKLWKL